MPRDPADLYRPRDLAAMAEPVRKGALDPVTVPDPEDFPLPPPPPFVDFTGVVDQAAYDRYRATGDLGELVAKAMTGPGATSADVGQSWLDALRDPATAAAASRDYELGRLGTR